MELNRIDRAEILSSRMGTMENLSDDLVTAIEQGEPISEKQLKELISAEARETGLSFDEAVRAAHERTLATGSLFASDIIEYRLDSPGVIRISAAAHSYAESWSG